MLPTDVHLTPPKVGRIRHGVPRCLSLVLLTVPYPAQRSREGYFLACNLCRIRPSCLRHTHQSLPNPARREAQGRFPCRVRYGRG